MKYSFSFSSQKFRKVSSSIFISIFFATLMMPWYNALAITGVFDTLQTVANVSPVTEVKATRTLSIGAVPADTETIVIGSCTVTFSAIAGATTDELDCGDNAASVDLDTDGIDTPRTAEDIASILRSITSLSDTGHGALAFSGSTTDVILTTFGTETAASVITFTDGTSGDITSSIPTAGTIPVSAVAQVVTFTPSAPTAGETFRGTINGTNYDYTVVGTKTVAEVVTAMTTLMDAHANAVCTDDTTHVTCTATPAGTAFLSYGASVVDITAPTLSQTTPVTTPTNDNTPAYTFTTNEAGTITYGGSCSSATTSAIVGANTISFNTLADGTYSNCTITVTDSETNASSALAVTGFTVDTTAPTFGLTSVSSNNAVTTKGKVGNVVTAIFTTTETLTANPTVTFGGQSMTFSTLVGSTYTYTRTLTGAETEGSASVVVTGTDVAGNTTTSSNIGTGSFTTDFTAPTVGIIMADTALKVGETSLVTFTFSESVSGFTNDDVITVANGTLNTIAGSGTTYTATFTPNASVEDSTNIITVDKTGVLDGTSNPGVGSTSTANYTVDTLATTISDVSSAALYPPGAAITWTTSEGATSQVEYGLTTGYGSTTTVDATLVTNHTVNITGLPSGITYHYRVISVDAAGNVTTGSDTTFPASTGGGGGGGGGIGVIPPVVVTVVPDSVTNNGKSSLQINSAPEQTDAKMPVSFKNIQKHINNIDIPVLPAASNEFATREQTVTLAVTIRGVELSEYYACEGRHSDTQGDNISESTCQIAEKAQNAGIISRSKTTFRPLDSVTRVEAYSMLMKSACITIDKNNADWRQNVIEKAIELGFTKRTFETFSPDRSILISEIIAIGKRLESWKEQNGSCTE